MTGRRVDPAADPLVVFIRSQPGMAERLLAEHARDEFGRCPKCSAGAQTGRYRWPCTIYRCASEARETRDLDTPGIGESATWPR